jgi:hypothetical protein
MRIRPSRPLQEISWHITTRFTNDTKPNSESLIQETFMSDLKPGAQYVTPNKMVVTEDGKVFLQWETHSGGKHRVFRAAAFEVDEASARVAPTHTRSVKARPGVVVE